MHNTGQKINKENLYQTQREFKSLRDSQINRFPIRGKTSFIVE